MRLILSADLFYRGRQNQWGGDHDGRQPSDADPISYVVWVPARIPSNGQVPRHALHVTVNSRRDNR
jgi:hypothetical protein